MHGDYSFAAYVKRGYKLPWERLTPGEQIAKQEARDESKAAARVAPRRLAARPTCGELECSSPVRKTPRGNWASVCSTHWARSQGVVPAVAQFVPPAVHMVVPLPVDELVHAPLILDEPAPSPVSPLERLRKYIADTFALMPEAQRIELVVTMGRDGACVLKQMTLE